MNHHEKSQNNKHSPVSIDNLKTRVNRSAIESGNSKLKNSCMVPVICSPFEVFLWSNLLHIRIYGPAIVVYSLNADGMFKECLSRVEKRQA